MKDLHERHVSGYRTNSIRRPHRRLAATVVGFGIVLLAHTGCKVHKQFQDPVAVMSNPESTSNVRLAAMEQAAVKDPDNPERIESLKEILTGRGGHPLFVRTAAFEQLLQYDEDVAKATVFYRLPTIPSYDVVEYLCKRIVQEGWTDMTPALVRSLSTGKPFENPNERPDGRALLALHPGQTISEIVMDVVEDPGGGMLAERWRLSAWSLLHQLGAPRDQLRAWLVDNSKYNQGDDFFDALHLGYLELGVIPETVEELRWLETLRKPEFADTWTAFRTIRESVPDPYREGLRLRHFPVLMVITDHFPEWLNASRSELLAELSAELDSRKHYFSGVYAQGVGPLNPQTLEESADRLNWADLLTIKLAEHLSFDPTIRPALFQQVMRDRADESTEYGGILDIYADGRAMLVEYPPRRVANDTRYHASDEMILAGYTAPFHYHLHVQEVDNRQYAGPGSGDLNYANLLRINGIVYTSINEHELNVDYYQQGDLVVDLGVISSP